MLVHNFLENSAAQFPNKIALIHEDVRATYAEINSKADALACRLVAQGISQGDRVVLILENSLEYVVSYYGALKAGAVAAPLSTDLKPDGLRPLLAELEPKAIVSSGRFERMLQAADLAQFRIDALVLKSPKMAWSSLPIPVHSWDDLAQFSLTNDNGPRTTDSVSPQISVPCPVRRAPCPGEIDLDLGLSSVSSPCPVPRVPCTGEIDLDLASIIYTSGSTGMPKGVMLSHRNIVSNTQSICRYLELTENDIQMVVLPFFYVMGKSLLNTHFAAGGTVVINNKFAFPATVVNQMVEEQVTGFSGVPSTYAYLLHRSPFAKARDRLGSLRYCSQAGGHMSDAVKQELRRVLPDHTKIYIMYGATEASARLAYLEPDRFDEKMGSIGKPIPGTTLRVMGPESQEVLTGESGELVGQGPNIMVGYWRDDKATAKVLDEHGYHTGDLGYQDAEGYFYVTGRKDNLLKVGGHRINPQEIEDALMATQLVIEAAVLGRPDALLGQKLVALCCPKNGECSESLILGECAKKLPKYKMPGEVKLVRALPKSTSGKTDRAKCLELCSV